MKHEDFIEDLEALCKQYWDKYVIDPSPKKNPVHEHSITIAFSDKELKL